MKKIPSFTIDHIRLLRGIYVSRKDEVNGEVITTFDIRMKEPNREPALGQGALHTIEHLAATYLRNNQQWQDRIIYWGPMGCCRKPSASLPTTRVKFPVLLPRTVATICSTTFLWLVGSLPSICTRCSNT